MIKSPYKNMNNNNNNNNEIMRVCVQNIVK